MQFSSPVSIPNHWHHASIDTALTSLGSNPDQGLTEAEVRRRQESYGSNELKEQNRRRKFDIFIDQFRNVMLIMLLVVAVISAIIDIAEGFQVEQALVFPKDAFAILIVVILNGILGYVQESRAEEALAALKNMSAPKVRVLREGRSQEIDSPQLVVGDIVFLEAGVKISADGRLLEAMNLQVRESALTGEAEAVNKKAEVVLPEDTELGDRVNLVFSGTEITHGRGVALVTSIGMDTELGKIATALQSVQQEPTPLQKRMTELGNKLVWMALVLVTLVVGGGTLYNPELFGHLIKVSLSMAVAVVPEGLPAVITVTLALGTQRMVKRNALIRRLPAVETLGSVTTICSDKTGTLTQNKMVVQGIRTYQGEAIASGEGYHPQGNLQATLEETVATRAEQQLLLLGGVLCNDAVLQQEDGKWGILGDPTEAALLPLAIKGGLNLDRVREAFPRVGEFPFNSDRKRMSVFVTLPVDHDYALPQDPSYLMVTKGSPESILDRCRYIQIGEDQATLTPEIVQEIIKQNNELAAQGLRVLGLAYRGWQELPPLGSEDTSEQEMVWLGLVGILDPPRPEVKVAVETCRSAGIRPIMITGDHQLTAQAIAASIGICQRGDRVLTGREIEKMSSEELEQSVNEVSVYARVSPEHKLRIVRALQRQNQVVAMTGDGVNDAPALKQADIGVAMGITGTDVTKEASEMVLLDDNFATIVAATEEGRVIYGNIRRFIKYILGSNIGEVITIASAPLLGLGGVPLTPLQILWMNLVTDGLPALALAVEPGSANVMKRSPVKPKDSIFADGLGMYMVRVGLILAIVSIALMVWAYSYTNVYQTEWLHRERWTTMVFTTLCLAQMGHAIAVRSDTRLTLEMNPLTNPYIWAAVLLTTVLQLLLIYVTPLRLFFGTYWLSLRELAICVGCSFLIFVWVELEKIVLRFWRRSRS
ncbi:cation-translocating P-type ATPase [Candidatus Synechococcus calcipolaris G9]|uniref:Cation-translocating P-type ATPase n=1 Tax=Candidatus Synechococcus calcipolaris G9 TaxID=1497997 RepID=A0ABT6EZI3_9SYNE|nr:cation-translocating P-type ATPase [Candidatus Synechococcus calcipolaris]MDG2991015.1 cation-translocating P-type ATPase [Candidatus Synechococcus calcipolaris G9]